MPIATYIEVFQMCNAMAKKSGIWSGLISKKFNANKAELLKLNRTQFPSLGFLLVKKLEIEKTKTTFIISVLKDVY